MAAETEHGEIEGFGQVSRTVGTVFRYLLLAATMFGIVTLAVLLVYVANDAIRPLTADPGWYLTYFLTLVVPTLLVGAYVRTRDRAAFSFGAFLVGLFVVSLMFSGGVGLLVVDVVPPLVALAFALGLAVPAAFAVVLTRNSHRISFTPRLVATTLAFYLSLFGLPGPIGDAAGLPQVVPSFVQFVQSIPVIPVDWMMVAAVVGGGSAAAVGAYVAGVRDARAGLYAGLAAFGASVASAVVGPFVGLNPVPAVVVTAVALVPSATYAWRGAFGEEGTPAGLGFAATVNLALDLSHIAGLIAVVGTGVDDLVIIADEVMAEKVSSRRVFQSRFRKALWVIGAAAVTTIIAMSPLAVLSLGDLRGFAIITILGVLIGVLLTRPAYGDILRRLLTQDH